MYESLFYSLCQWNKYFFFLVSYTFVYTLWLKFNVFLYLSISYVWQRVVVSERYRTELLEGESETRDPEKMMQDIM